MTDWETWVVSNSFCMKVTKAGVATSCRVVVGKNLKSGDVKADDDDDGSDGCGLANQT